MSDPVMSQEEQDHLAVRIKHHGQCPYEKGHYRGDFQFGMWIGVIFASMFWCVMFALVHR